MVTERIGNRKQAVGVRKNLTFPSPRKDDVPGIIMHRAPLLAGAIGLDMLSTQLSLNSGSMEIGPGTLLFSNLANADPSNAFSAPNIMFHGTELLVAMGAAYGLGHMWGSRKDNNSATRMFMNGAIGMLGAFGLNNLWDAAYLHGMIPTVGPLDYLLDGGLNGLLNYWDFADSTGLGFGGLTALIAGTTAVAGAGVAFARKQYKKAHQNA